MIPLVKSIFRALLWDEMAARRWFRGALGTMAVSGVGFADQIASFLGAPRLIATIKVASLICALVAGVTSVGQQNPKSGAPQP